MMQRWLRICSISPPIFSAWIRPLLERIVVERKDVVTNQTAGQLVSIFVVRKKLIDAHADLLLELFAQVAPHVANGRIHRMVTRAGIDTKPFDLHVEHPLQQFELATRMHAEIAHQILLWLILIVAVISGMQDEDVSLLDLQPSLT